MTGTSLRLDRYLWHTRLVKSRSLAQRLCEAGRVSLNGAEERRSARAVKPGDIVRLEHAGMAIRIEVVQLGDRRGPATEARRLYVELERSRLAESWEPLLGEGLEEGEDD